MILNQAIKGAQPEAPALPDAGKPYVESVTYNKDTKKVRLRAQTARAGEVKMPLGDWQEFPIDIHEDPQFAAKGVVYLYRMSNDGDPEDVWTDTEDMEEVIVNGENCYTYGETSVALPMGGYDNTHCTVCSRVKPLSSEGYIDYIPLNANNPNRLKYDKESYISFSSEGYIVISRNVEVL